MIGRIFNIQEMTFHDGPGARITVFLKGCPLKCAWCHNPEGFSFEKELLYKKEKCLHCGKCDNFTNPENCMSGALVMCGQDYTVDALLNKLLAYKDLLKAMDGGVTFSGGEPLAQYAFLKEILRRLKANGIHTCIETSGYIDEALFKDILNYLDFVIFDIKVFDDEKHIAYTSVSNTKILNNAKTLMASNVPHLFRTPLIEGYTDDSLNLDAIASFLRDEPWEKVASNPLAKVKYNWLINHIDT